MPRAYDDRHPAIPTAAAVAGPPAGGRRMWLAVVLVCPRCRGLHAHRAANATRLLGGEAVRRCPTTRARYVLDVGSSAVAS